MAKKMFKNKNDGVAKEKKPFYKRSWCNLVAAIFIIGAFGGDDEEADVAT